MERKLLRSGARLAHPSKAFIVHGFPIPETYQGDWKNLNTERYHFEKGSIDRLPSDVNDYILRLTVGTQMLFGPMKIALHTLRTYSNGQLEFHNDLDEEVVDDDPRVIVRGATCVHNATPAHRYLTFRRKLWTGHLETFPILIPAYGLLIFGDELLFDYEHGIPKADEVKAFQSIVTRFKEFSTDKEEM